MHSKYFLYVNEKEKNQILIGRRPVKSLNTDVTKCLVISEILYFFPDNGTDQEKLCKPLMYTHLTNFFDTYVSVLSSEASKNPTT